MVYTKRIGLVKINKKSMIQVHENENHYQK